MRHTIQLVDTTFKREAKIFRQAFSKHSRNSVHSRCFQGMDRKQPWVTLSNYSPNRIHVCIRKNILNERVGGNCIADFRRCKVRMLMRFRF